MSEPKWTPGPWEAKKWTKAWRIDFGDYTIAFGIQKEDDAYLMASSREMREALESYMSTYVNTDHHPTATEEARCMNLSRSALAKSRGKS